MINSDAAAEAALIEQARRGDRQAYGELVRQHHPGTIRVVFRMCGDVALAEDAAQDAFIKAWMNLDRFRPGSSFRNWLYRIAVNAALDALRRNKKTHEMSIEDMPLRDTQESPEAAVMRAERAEDVQAAIQALPEAGRLVIVLREYGELSYKEIAEVLDIPLGTVMSRLNYARKQLRGALADQYRESETVYV